VGKSLQGIYKAELHRVHSHLAAAMAYTDWDILGIHEQALWDSIRGGSYGSTTEHIGNEMGVRHLYIKMVHLDFQTPSPWSIKYSVHTHPPSPIPTKVIQDT